MAQAQKLSTTQIWSDLQALPHCQMARCMTATWCYSVFNKEEAFTAWHERQAKNDKSMGSETACSKKNVEFVYIWARPIHPTLLWGRKYQCFTPTHVCESSSLLIWWREVNDWVNPLFEVVFFKNPELVCGYFSQFRQKPKIIVIFLTGFLSNKQNEINASNKWNITSRKPCSLERYYTEVSKSPLSKCS